MSKIVTDYDREVQQFTDAMKYKLHANRHKGKWEGKEIKELFQLLRKEVDELESEINSAQQNQIAIILEAADIGNFAMIISNIAMRIAAGENAVSSFSSLSEDRINKIPIVALNYPTADMGPQYGSAAGPKYYDTKGVNVGGQGGSGSADNYYGDENALTMKRIRERHAPHVTASREEIAEAIGAPSDMKGGGC